ncbi:MAG TPA: hypothetical protein EYP73_02460 [Acidimicrobiia bacterium]|nr:hypothetical protein [Acidimicrobiia bacterium]
MNAEALAPAFTALEAAESSMHELHEGCCSSKRAPCIAELGDTLEETRQSLERLEADHGLGDVIITTLEDVGGQLGRLQVTCCTPKRVPLYARLLEDLTKVQLTVKRALKKGH